MSFDYFSKRRMQYILEKLKTIFDTKTETWTGTQAELAQQLSSIKNGTVINITDDDESLTTNLSALTDTNISSPIDGQGLVYDNTSEKWENKNLFSGNYNDLTNKPTIPSVIDNLTSTSTSDALSAKQGKVLKDALDAKAVKFIITVSESEDPQTGDEVLIADKTPSEVLTALSSDVVVEAVYEGRVCSVVYNTLSEFGDILFGLTGGANEVGVFFTGLMFTKDSQDDVWESITLMHSEATQSLHADIDYSNNTYSCDYTYDEFEDAKNNGRSIFVRYDNVIYHFTKYDSSEYTYYFSSTLADSDGTTTKTFAMVGDDNTGDWDSITLTESSGGSASAFLLTISEDETTHERSCDKLPSEILAAYTNGDIIQAFIGDYDNIMLDLVACVLTDDPYMVIFSTTYTSSSWSTLTLSLVLTKDSSTDTWDDIEVNQRNLHYQDIEITKSGNVYSCSTPPSLLIDAIELGIGAKVISAEDNKAYILSKIDSTNKTYYFTSSDVNSLGNITISTFVMVSNQNESSWTSITKYETDDSGEIIWTGTQAELALVVNTLPEGTIINITDDQEVIGGSLAALSDTNISSPTNGQGLIYNSTTQKWENQNLPSGSNVFTITLTPTEDPQTGEVTFTSDKLPSEVIAAKNSGSLIRLTATDTIDFYFNLNADSIAEDSAVFIFSNFNTSSAEYKVSYIGFTLIKADNSDTWASIEMISSEAKDTLVIEMEESSGVYSCSEDFDTLDYAYWGSMDMFIDFNKEIFRLVKYDSSEDTFYFASTISDSNGITTKTFVMVGDSSENEWTSITLIESSGGGTGDTTIWTGTMAEYVTQASQIPVGAYVNITDDQETIPAGGLYPHVVISTDTGSTILITKGTNSIIPTETSTGIYEADIPNYGTWTISATKDEDTRTKNINVNVVMIYEITIYHGVDGSTVLPTDDIQIWLACADITNKSYTTLAEVLADRETFETLLRDSNACDYMARSTSWAGNASVKVPTMTSYTAPSGVVGYSSVYSGFPWWWAFDGNITAEHDGMINGTSGYVSYQFTKSVKVNKVSFYNRTGVGGIKDFTVDYLDTDGTTWQTVYTGSATQESSKVKQEFAFDNNISSTTWRISILNGHGATNAIGFNGCQFTYEGLTTDESAMALIGKYDYCSNALLGNATWAEAIANSEYWDSVLQPLVPTMTSNTTPSGECISSGIYSASYANYKAFDGTLTGEYDAWVAPSGQTTSWIGYDFGFNVMVMKFIVTNRNYASTVPYITSAILQGFDGNDWNNIQTYNEGFPTTNMGSASFIVDRSNVGRYSKYRLYVTSFTGASYLQVGLLQFYGRVSSNVSNTNGKIHTAMGNESVYCVETGDTYTAINGLATVDFSDFDEGTYTFGSTTAKNPNDLTEDFKKRFRITKNPYGGTTELYLLPDTIDTLYWYGYMSDNLYEINSTNGYSYSTGSLVAPTYNTNNMLFNGNAGSRGSGVGTLDKLLTGTGCNTIQKATILNIGLGSCITAKEAKNLGDAQAIVNQAETKVLNQDTLLTINLTQDSYVWCDAHHYREGYCYGFWLDRISSDIPTFISAANDSLYIMDGNTKVYIANTNSKGKSYEPLLEAGTYTIYSSVAKDPNNLSNPYSKSVTITEATQTVAVMPENTLYWWGYENGIEAINTANGYTSAYYTGYTYGNPTYNTTYISITSASNTCVGVGSVNALSNITKVIMIAQGVTLPDNIAGFINSVSNKASFNYNSTLSSNVPVNTTSIAKYEKITSNSYPVVFNDSSRSMKLNALWYE